MGQLIGTEDNSMMSSSSSKSNSGKSQQQGRHRGPTDQNVQSSIEKLNEARDVIEQRQMLLQTKIAEQIALAKNKSRMGDKSGALLCLKRKKMYEMNIGKYDNAIMTVEQQINSVETMQLNVVSLDALSQSAAVLKSMTSVTSVDDVAETMDDMKEHYDSVQEIGNLLSTDFSGLEFDDSALNDELNALIDNENEYDHMIIEKEQEELKSLKVPTHAIQMNGSKNSQPQQILPAVMVDINANQSLTTNVKSTSFSNSSNNNNNNNTFQSVQSLEELEQFFG